MTVVGEVPVLNGVPTLGGCLRRGAAVSNSSRVPKIASADRCTLWRQVFRARIRSSSVIVTVRRWVPSEAVRGNERRSSTAKASFDCRKARLTKVFEKSPISVVG